MTGEILIVPALFLWAFVFRAIAEDVLILAEIKKEVK